MSKVLTFARNFPAYHPKKGQPTHFVQKIFDSLLFQEEITMSRNVELSRAAGIEIDLYSLRTRVLEPKHHTIRAGNRWKVGDKFSPRVWGDDINPKNGKSGPYQSKQITFAPDIEVKKVWPVEIDACGVISVNGKYLLEDGEEETLAANDGLTMQDFADWLIMPVFRKKVAWAGQIICWNENINY